MKIYSNIQMVEYYLWWLNTYVNQWIFIRTNTAIIIWIIIAQDDDPTIGNGVLNGLKRV